MTTTVWLLDVDGVINAPRAGWDTQPQRSHVTTDGIPFRLSWEPRVVAAIRRLHTTVDSLDIRWCTSWCHWAGQLERLWELPRLSRAFHEPINGAALSIAKLAAAREVLAQGHRLIWTDDTEVPEWGEVHDELTAGGRALLIAPDDRVGLQPEHLQQIEDFATAKPEKQRGACPTCARPIVTAPLRRDSPRVDSRG